MISRIGALKSFVVLVAFVGATTLEAQTMPDPKVIAGVPLPVTDMPAGTVTVRVIKGSLANNIAGQKVELFVNGAGRQQTTGETGRAEFSGLPSGARVKALAVVERERLESQEFAVPPAGGIRVMLVATDPELAKRADEDRRLAAAPAQQGTVVLGEQSRFVFELGDEALNVFNILQILNTARTPVQTRDPVVFEASPNGGTVTVLDGSSPQATADGRRVRVAGPFAPGMTLVQFAYSVPYSSANLTVQQHMPIGLNQLTVMAQKVGNMHLSSPQMSEHREMSAQGQTYLVGQGPGIRAGDAVSFTFTGLPYAASWPRNVALGLAALILAGGAWSSVRTPTSRPADANRGTLETRRDRLFTALTAIEHQRRAGTIDPVHHASRRRELITELESIYAALDTESQSV